MNRGMSIAVSVAAVWLMMCVPAIVVVLSGGASGEDAARMSSAEVLVIGGSYLALSVGMLAIHIGAIVLTVFIAVKLFIRRSDGRSESVGEVNG